MGAHDHHRGGAAGAGIVLHDSDCPACNAKRTVELLEEISGKLTIIVGVGQMIAAKWTSSRIVKFLAPPKR